MIRILEPDEAKKIAAGEVIDRPAALVRELIDNALDAGALNIELSIEKGGIKKTEIVDDGCGMNKNDLSLCIKTHATSKIQSLDDLSRFTTLGFRGEALAAAAAVARLEIVTSTDGKEAWLLETEPYKLTQTRRNRGTSVRAFGLFDSIPARKRFLKREPSEAMLCRQIFTEKAMAFPGVSFRFVQDGVLKLQFLSCTNTGENASVLQKRFGESILEPQERSFLHAEKTAGKGFSVTIVFGGPELFRKDRRQQYIFANKRRIQDFGMMQALEFGLAGLFPNGTHPLGAVFIDTDPAMADFNIHPAKREVRFADSGAIHHSVTAALRKYIHGNTHDYTHIKYGNEPVIKTTPEKQEGFISLSSGNQTQEAFAAEKETGYNPVEYSGSSAGNAEKKHNNIRLVGRVFDLFIIVEQGDKLYLIDQHAAHERILYDHFLSANISTQKLLIPIPFSTGNDEEDTFLQTKKDEFTNLGIMLQNEGGGSWLIEALPAGWKTTDSKTVEVILALQNANENLVERWAATLACHTAIKDGNYLDDKSALSLAESVLKLSDKEVSLPRCPHGRPLWKTLSRDELFKAVRRKE
ncbi:MAG: DNA mismatch repair endonuclease MutL [Treponema sp.]|nr:DNA mismatch repair endonuclease MutL [Treponema sp.]